MSSNNHETKIITPLNHPCRDKCSGWQAGLDAMKVEAMKLRQAMNASADWGLTDTITAFDEFLKTLEGE